MPFSTTYFHLALSLPLDNFLCKLTWWIFMVFLLLQIRTFVTTSIISQPRVVWLFHPMLPDFRKSNDFWKVSRFCPFVLLVRATRRRRWVWSIGGMTLTRENRASRTKPCPSATMPTTNLTWTELEPKPGLRSETPATNRLSHNKCNTDYRNAL